MQFVYPSFLLALLAIAIPIIVHLFNFRKYQKVYFTNLKFLKEVQEETKSKSRLKHLLILASRILLISFLVFAFAQPFLPVSDSLKNKNSKAASIYIDNSFSMNNIGTNGQLFNVAKQYAFEIVKQAPETKRHQILTSDNAAANKRLLAKDNAIHQISNLQVNASNKNTSQVFAEQKNVLKDKTTKAEVFWISDFSKANTDLSVLQDSNFIFHLVPLSANKLSNVSIDSCWFENPIRLAGKEDVLKVKLSNWSDDNITNLPLSLTLNNKTKSIENINIKPNSQTEVEIKFTQLQTGWINGRLSIDDYPIQFDNALYFAYNIPKSSSVLVVNGQEEILPINKLFSDDSSFVYSQVNASEPYTHLLKNNELIVLNGVSELSSATASDLSLWVNQGGRLVVIPPFKGSIEQINSFLSTQGVSTFGKLDTQKTKVSFIDYEHPLMASVFEKKTASNSLPVVDAYYPLLKGSVTNNELLKQANGLPFFIEQEVGAGKIYQSSVSGSEKHSNFSKNALFVVLFYQLGISNEQSTGLYNTLGQDPFFSINSLKKSESNYTLFSEGLEIIPEIRNKGLKSEVWYHDQLSAAGMYQLKLANENLALFALNYNQNESNLNFYSASELEEITEPYGNVMIHKENFDKIGLTLDEIEHGKQLWQLMLALALLMIVFEILLIKFWKE